MAAKKLITGAAAAMLGALVFASGATAYSSTSPTVHDFGAQELGTQSSPASFTIHVRCLPDPANPMVPVCFGPPEPLTPNVVVPQPFTITSNGCTSPMPGDSTFGTFCSFSVAFRPLALGPAMGVGSIGDPGGFGQFALKGTGVAAPTIPPPSATPQSKKKCKKGRKLRKGKCVRRKRR